MNHKKVIYSAAIFGLAFSTILSSCSLKTDMPTPSKGSMDPTKYVALGNSITAGFADAALYYDGQMVSYPNLIAQQFSMIGGGEFRQPLVAQSSVGVGSSGNAKLVLGVVNGALAPVPAASSGDLTIFNTIASQGPFNNMGVPGAKVITAVYPGYGNPANGMGNFNPFFYRMTTAPTTASMLSDAVAQKATFFSVFLGSNDVLSYATNGGSADAITPVDGAVGVGFNNTFDYIVGSLTSNNAKGVIANVPDITSIPFFATVPYNGLALSSQAQADALNAAYGALGMKFQVGSNAFVIADAAAPGGIRQIKQGELILLTALSSLSTGMGSSTPIPASLVLDANEVAAIKAATTAYNAHIQSVAQTKGLAFVDVAGFMARCKAGIVYNGRDINASFVTGGAFSLDGIHLTPLGNAMLANEFIKAINATYGSVIPHVDASNYSGVKFP